MLQQLREIWTRYGSLDEIWFDGGWVFIKKNDSIIKVCYIHVYVDIQRPWKNQ